MCCLLFDILTVIYDFKTKNPKIIPRLLSTSSLKVADQVRGWHRQRSPVDAANNLCMSIFPGLGSQNSNFYSKGYNKQGGVNRVFIQIS